MPALGILLQPPPPAFLLLIPARTFRVLVSASTMSEVDGWKSLDTVLAKMPLLLLRTGSCGLLVPRGPLPFRSLSFLPMDFLGALVLINQDRASLAILNQSPRRLALSDGCADRLMLFCPISQVAFRQRGARGWHILVLRASLAEPTWTPRAASTS